MKKQLSELLFKKYSATKAVLPPHNPTADLLWVTKQSLLPWLPLDLNVPHEIILKEIDNIKDLFVTHRDDYAEHAGWASFCIHGKSYDATREDEYYNDSRPFLWSSEAINLMPQTVKYFQEQWPGKNFKRVRVMRLSPGGFIAIHKDDGVTGLYPINIAITHPTGCNFVIDKHGTVPFTPGRALLLDVSQYHTVFNQSNKDRYHIIVHQDHMDKRFNEIVVKSYHMLYNSNNENSYNYNQRRS